MLAATDSFGKHVLAALAHAQSPLHHPGLFGVHALQSAARWPPQLTSEAVVVVAADVVEALATVASSSP